MQIFGVSAYGLAYIRNERDYIVLRPLLDLFDARDGKIGLGLDPLDSSGGGSIPTGTGPRTPKPLYQA
jgi:hypothetical protein